MANTEKFRVLWVYQQIRGRDGVTLEGGQQPSLCVRGRKFMLCVTAGFPVHVLKREVRDFDKLRRVSHGDGPYPVAQAVTTYTEMARRLGITQGAQKILDRAAGALQEELNEDQFNNEEEDADALNKAAGEFNNEEEDADALNKAAGEFNNEEEEEGVMKGKNLKPTDEIPAAEEPAAEATAIVVARPKRKRAPKKAAAATAPVTETFTTTEETTTMATKKAKGKGKRAAKKAARKANGGGGPLEFREGSKAARALEFWKVEIAKAQAKAGKGNKLPQGTRKEIIERMAKKCDLTVGSAGSLYQNFSAAHSG
jgi:hypothetical protein